MGRCPRHHVARLQAETGLAALGRLGDLHVGFKGVRKGGSEVVRGRSHGEQVWQGARPAPAAAPECKQQLHCGAGSGSALAEACRAEHSCAWPSKGIECQPSMRLAGGPQN